MDLFNVATYIDYRQKHEEGLLKKKGTLELKKYIEYYERWVHVFADICMYMIVYVVHFVKTIATTRNLNMR